MKSLKESLTINEDNSIAKLRRIEKLFKSDRISGYKDKYGEVRFDSPIEIGENDAYIDALVSADTIRVDIAGNTDAINLKFFSDEVYELILDELEQM